MNTLLAPLASHPFCAGLAAEHIDQLAACASEVQFLDGETVAAEGLPADATFLMLSGRIVLKSGRHIVETVEQDEMLGWSWLFGGTAWHVHAEALGVVRTLRLDGGCLAAAMDADPTFGLELARRVLHHVHRRLERARLRSIDVFGTET